MIQEIVKYVSDIDDSFEFTTRESAEEFERQYGPWYVLLGEEHKIKKLIVDGADVDRQAEGERIFAKAKQLLVEYINSVTCQKKEREKWAAVTIERSSLSKVVRNFESTAEPVYESDIIATVFYHLIDILYVHF